MNEMKEKSKAFARTIMQKIHTYGFWCLLVFAAGSWAGITYTNHSQAGVTDTAIKLGGFVFKGDVYDITARPKPIATVTATAPPSR